MIASKRAEESPEQYVENVTYGWWELHKQSYYWTSSLYSKIMEHPKAYLGGIIIVSSVIILAGSAIAVFSPWLYSIAICHIISSSMSMSSRLINTYRERLLAAGTGSDIHLKILQYTSETLQICSSAIILLYGCSMLMLPVSSLPLIDNFLSIDNPLRNIAVNSLCKNIAYISLSMQNHAITYWHNAIVGGEKKIEIPEEQFYYIHLIRTLTLNTTLFTFTTVINPNIALTIIGQGLIYFVSSIIFKNDRINCSFGTLKAAVIEDFKNTLETVSNHAVFTAVNTLVNTCSSALSHYFNCTLQFPGLASSISLFITRDVIKSNITISSQYVSQYFSTIDKQSMTRLDQLQRAQQAEAGSSVQTTTQKIK
jgi:hypothetical protein